MVKRTFLWGALILIEMDGNDLPSPINSDVVKKYYAWKKRRNLSWKSAKDDLGLQRSYLDWKPAKGSSLRMIDLQKKKSGSHFLYDLNVHWAYFFVTPFSILILYLSKFIQINTKLCIFLICLFMSFIHIIHDPNDYFFSKMVIKNTRDIALYKVLG